MGLNKHSGRTAFIFSWAGQAVLFLMVASVMSPVSVATLPEPVRAELISDRKTVQPGHTLSVGLWLKIDEGWHTYWKNPGDSGLATRIAWHLPEDFKAADIQWPIPQKFETPTEMTYGYEGEVLLITDIQVPVKAKPGTRVKISARVDWLACREECIPGQAELEMEISIKKEESRSELRWTDLFKKTRTSLPKQINSWDIRAFGEKNRIFINISALFKKGERFRDIYFFSDQVGLVDHAANQELKKRNSEYVLEIQRSEYSAQLPSRLTGILFSKEGWNATRDFRAVYIDVPLKTLE